MATQSTPSPTQNQQNPGMEEEKKNDAMEEATNLDPEKPAFLTNPDPIREDQVQNAVRFLSHPKVRGSPVIYRRSFLEKKGLNKEEIDEAFRRVPDQSPSSGTNAEAPVSTQAAQPNPSTAVQPPPAAQPTAVIAPAVVKRTFNWYHIVLATGILASSGVGTAFFFKRVVMPRVKTWIKKVVSEGEEEAEKEEKQNSKLAEEAAEAAKAAASAAALVAKASQDLLSSKNEEKGYFEAFMRALDVQVKEMKSMGETIKKLENKRENVIIEEQFNHSAPRNGPVSNIWGAQPVNTNGISTADYVRPSSAPQSTEPINHKSYMEMMSMGAQRTERAPSAKPWETAPPPMPTHQKPTYTYAQSHSSDDSSNPEIPEQQAYALNAATSSSSYPLTNNATTKIQNYTGATATDSSSSSEPWWRKKSDDAGPTSETHVQPMRRWVPPQPPPVAMPEAVAAIHHQPKPKSDSISGEDGVDAMAVKTDDMAVKPDDVAAGPSNGVQIVDEAEVDAA